MKRIQQTALSVSLFLGGCAGIEDRTITARSQVGVVEASEAWTKDRPPTLSAQVVLECTWPRSVTEKGTKKGESR
jgi:hypothetical protein